jgi:hypothetical protein
MVEQRVRSMDEEVGYAAESNIVLVRSADRRAAVVLRALTAFTSGYEVEIVFVSREPGGASEFERWDNLDTTDNGPKLGFAYTLAMPRLHNPRSGGTDDEPLWNPSALWGGAGGDSGEMVVARNLRARLGGPAPSGVVTIGWSWLARGITAGNHPLDAPPAEDVERFAASIWAQD